ncbi:uncharacterized protein DUF3159 [Diaminobutyricimonas aerilata]|uniref:Uncharacterized protein DUF3159 n=1 Tax=Diaminobutyricimonas aerilata TaxID=1162967 RepID=A0A2M9CKE0_9MICO|nr:DUF3159 domain-containing protein [Diaminobutyricimonas aerilata]PJJ72357.1 uncharacterized protein DUF3159 [Diaminobutyricimonas aerilata]
MSEPREPDPAPSLSDTLSAAAQRAGFARVAPGETPTASALLAAVGGVRGLVESILPGLVFLVVYTITADLVPSVIVPIAVAALFVIVRLITRTPVMPAVVGAIGIAASATLALLSGRAEDNFVPGFWINAISLTTLVASLIARWPLVGVIVGLLTSDLSGWRADRAKMRVMTVATVLWAGLFALRLGVQLPLYFSGNVEWLAGTKLLMGVPLYAGLLWVTWLLVRAVYARPEGAADAR